MSVKKPAAVFLIVAALTLSSCLSSPRLTTERQPTEMTVIKIEGLEGYIPCRIFNDALYAGAEIIKIISGTDGAPGGETGTSFNVFGSKFLLDAGSGVFHLDGKPKPLRHPVKYEGGALWVPLSFFEDYFSLERTGSSPIPVYRRGITRLTGALSSPAGEGRVILSLKFGELPKADYLYCGDFAKLFFWAPPGEGFSAKKNDDAAAAYSLTADTSSYPPSLTLGVSGYEVSGVSFFPKQAEALIALKENKPAEDTGGVTYKSINTAVNGARNSVHLVFADLNSGGIEVVPLISGGSIKGRNTTSSMSENILAEAAVNGSFYLADGDPLGMLVIKGKLLSENIYGRSSLVMYRDGRVSIEKLNARLYLDIAGQVIRVGGINRQPGKGELVLFTPEYADKFEARKNFTYFRIDGETLGAREKSKRLEAGSSLIICCSDSCGSLNTLKGYAGKKALIYVQYDGRQEVLHAIGGGPMIVKDGKAIVSEGLEKFRDDIIFDRHPRTAAAITHDNRLILAVVDGRSRESQGMTLFELAAFLISLGAKDAINFDGGGSSTMVFQNVVVNEPSDGSERPVSNSLAIIKNPLK